MNSGPGEAFGRPQGLRLAFINISDQNSIKDPAHQQLARTQAIKYSLHRKRCQLQLASNNFVDETPISIGRRRKRGSKEAMYDTPQLPRRSASFQTSIVDPFETLTVDANRLASLLRHSSARQAGEPVFSFNDSVDYQDLRSVFHSGLEDPALSSALCLTLAFAANGGIMDTECSAYRLKCIQHVNQKLSNPTEAASTTTVGTVLLLVGVECRLGERETAQTHLNGTRQLMQLCDQRKARLSHAVKRAIFWQDLFTAMITGTDRILSHETFAEMHWKRDPLQARLHSIPPGFAERADILGCEFLDIVADICALQSMRESSNDYPYSSLEVEKVDNQQAWIESRLQKLGEHATEPLLLSSIPAAYLCGYGLFAEVWNASMIPSHLSAQLLRNLQQYETWHGWDGHAELLLWLLNVGAAFSTDDPTRLGFAALRHGSHRVRLDVYSTSWEEVKKSLKRFIWSDIMYEPRLGTFWERCQNG